uniref:Protein kinase domain-containing protein n=1 Tax=Timema poppense TaxID=170557 RepID=A0A7R9H313_TIMPO|nr:unnamed protein product [Timema poppensis]
MDKESGYTIDETRESHPEHLSESTSSSGKEPPSQVQVILTPAANDVNPPQQCAIGSNSNEISRSEVDGPMITLGGTWQFRQTPDSISLSSHSSDEHTTFTDTDSAVSGISSPLQSGDLQSFTPSQQLSPTSETAPSQQPSSLCDKTEASNSAPLPPNKEAAYNISTLQRADLQLFDPLQQATPIEQTCALPLSPGALPQSQASNTWLLCQPVLSPLDSGITRDDGETVSIRTQDFRAAADQCGDSSAFSHVTEGLLSSEAFRNYPLLLDNGVSSHNHNVNYIFEAAYHVSQAHQYEANEEFEAAFAFYKAGIACLLSGVQDDPDTKRRQSVKEKTARYLLQAERIYNTHLSLKHSISTTEVFAAPGTSSKPRGSSSQLHRPLVELRSFKVLGIVGKVMLVLNTLEDRCYVIKVLQKSPCPVNPDKRTVMPQNVPYMVSMYRYYETEHGIFLVLKHASGGKLWHHVGSYFQSLPQTPTHAPVKGNAYQGRKVVPEDVKKCVLENVPSNNPELADPPLESDDGNSYLKLIRDYQSSTSKQIFTTDEPPTGPEMSLMNHADKSYSKNEQPTEQCSAKPDINPQHIHLTPISSSQESITRLSPKPEDSKSDNYPLPDIGSFKVSFSNSVPDLVPKDASAHYSWVDLETIPTTDLVEKAQKLLESVNKTLQTSESATDKNSQNSDTLEMGEEEKVFISSASDNTNAVAYIGCTDMSAQYVSGDRHVLCSKSEDAPKSVSRPRERRLSSGRRPSVASRRCSVERRYSNDDLFDVRSRTHSGSSLDRSHLSRLESMVDQTWPRLPETTVRLWACELLVAVETLHRWGIICRDLRPDNVLLGEGGHLLLTYQCQWSAVDALVCTEAVERLYSAPEVNGIFPLTPSVDWWSFGALVFELLAGKSLLSCHPGGIHNHTILNIPECLSQESKSLLTQLLKYNPSERLGSGVNGAQELKEHPFFTGVDWQAVLDIGTSFS